MPIRPAHPGDGPRDDAGAVAGAVAGPGDSGGTGGARAQGPLRWRADRRLPWLKLAGAAGLALLGYALATDPLAVGLAVVVPIALAAWAARDLIRPVRLAADHDGVTVVDGYGRAHRLAWDQIERVRVDARPRRGLRSEILEIDAGQALYLLGPFDLGAPPDEVAADLNALRRPGP